MQIRLDLVKTNYRIAGNFRGVLIFVIFVTIPRVTKFSTHEFFHPRIFSRLLTSFAYRASGVTKFKTTKINSEDPRQLFTKICTPENYPLYGILRTHIHLHLLCKLAKWYNSTQLSVERLPCLVPGTYLSPTVIDTNHSSKLHVPPKNGENIEI